MLKLSRLAVAALAAVAVATVPAAAHADPAAGVTCAFGTQFNPALKLLTPHTVTSHVEYQFGNCLSLSQPQVTSGAAVYSMTVPNMTCLNIASALDASFTIVWNTGQASTVTITQTLLATATVVIGTVTSGLFAGRTITIVTTGIPLTAPIECLTSGLTIQAGTATADH